MNSFCKLSPGIGRLVQQTCLLLSFGGCTVATHLLIGQLNKAAIRSIATTPEHLNIGSPFLLTVRLAGKATGVTGEWDHQTVQFWKPRSTSVREAGGEAWYALIGVDVGIAPGTYPLSIRATLPDGFANTTEQITVGPAHYRTTALTVPENFVEPDEGTKKRIAIDKEVKDRIFAHSEAQPTWSGDFDRPVTLPSTDSFGTRRTFNGKVASIHRGMDFRAPSGTPVAAANSGKIVLARNLFFEGNLVVIDHGQGFFTLYMHLSKIDVAEGVSVRKGQRLGLSGATGRATGPHLHFAARWQGAYVDPAGLFRLDLAGKP
jgi:murein DD-endopeptidase MepM/ murein hydrolase activator NlpD